MDMSRKTLTDSGGDTLEFRAYSDGEIFVEACDGNSFGIAGPFTSEQLRAALDEFAPAGSCTRTDEDWKARAERAEEERDHLATVLETTARQRDEADKRNARPLTPDAITDEMVLRFWNAFLGLNDGLEDMTLMSIDEVRTGLSAALTEPPARPEGAAEIEALLWNGSEDDEMTVLDAEDRRLISNYLASRGVRVVTEEQP